MILPAAPLPDEDITYLLRYAIPNLSSSGENVTAYRFVNPLGVAFDGVCAAPSMLSLSLLLPGLPVAEASFFPGYAWINLFVPSCADSESAGNPHLGWAFYEVRGEGVRNVPTFVFLVIEGQDAGAVEAGADMRFGYAPSRGSSPAAAPLKRNRTISGPASPSGAIQAW